MMIGAFTLAEGILGRIEPSTMRRLFQAVNLARRIGHRPRVFAHAAGADRVVFGVGDIADERFDLVIG